MDNASCHTVINPEDKVPTMSSAKTKRDLLQLINNSEKSKATIFRISHILEEHGHTSLRLPPYHPQLNPIELIWAEIKKTIALVNTTFKIKDVKMHKKDAIVNIEHEYWKKCENHVKK